MKPWTEPRLQSLTSGSQSQVIIFWPRGVLHPCSETLLVSTLRLLVLVLACLNMSYGRFSGKMEKKSIFEKHIASWSVFWSAKSPRCLPGPLLAGSWVRVRAKGGICQCPHTLTARPDTCLQMRCRNG